MSKRITTSLVVAIGLFAAPVAAQSDALQIHGYVTQAWVDATDYGFLGTSTEPSTDYRALALQFRYQVADPSTVVVQLSHRRLGNNLMNSVTPDVEVDWAFYQHRIGDFRVQAGKIPTPRLLYNNVRDVGTLHPFYRAPFNFYRESGETTDGITIGHMASLPAGFSLETNVVAGAWDYIQVSALTGEPSLMQTRMDKSVGGNFWLLAPVPGVRAGAGYLQFESDMPQLTGQLDPKTGTSVYASAEAKFDRVRVASEVSRFKPGAFVYDAWYVSGGVRLVEQLWLNGQADIADLDIPNVVDLDYSRDYAVGLSYAFTPSIVAKVEAHEVKGYNLDAAANLMAAPLQTRYGIVSLSAAF